MAPSAVSGGRRIPRRMVAVVVAVMAAFVLGAFGGYLFKALTISAVAGTGQVFGAQPGASEPGSAWNYSGRRSGTQSFDDPAPTSSPSTAPFRQPANGRTGPQS